MVKVHFLHVLKAYLRTQHQIVLSQRFHLKTLDILDKYPMKINKYSLSHVLFIFLKHESMYIFSRISKPKREKLTLIDLSVKLLKMFTEITGEVIGFIQHSFSSFSKITGF